MKKWIALLIAVTLFATITTKAEDQAPKPIDGFRGFTWDAPYEEILQNTPNAQGDGGKMILEYDYSKLDLDKTNHEVKIAGYPMTAVYCFTDGLLTSGIYMVDIEAEKIGTYYQEYLDLVDAYTKVYGSPRVSLDGWKDENDFMKDYPEYYDGAVAKGNVSFLTAWAENKDSYTSDILIILGGSDNKISFSIKYEKESSFTNSKNEETTADNSGI